MDINIDDKYIKRGYPPVLLEVDSTMERIQSIISLYKHIIELIEVVKLIKPDWEDNIEHIFFGEDEVLPDDDKAVHLTNNLINFVNDDTKFQSLSQVADTVAQAIETLRSWVTANYISKASQQYSTLKVVANNGQHTGSYTNFVKGTVITIPTNSLTFTIKVPATYNAPLITMSGLAVPMVTGTDETIDDVLYHVYTSANAYADNISVQIF